MRRTIVIVTAAVLVLGSTAAGAALWVSHRSGEPLAAVTPQGAAGLKESPTLSSAPWIYQDRGAAHIQTVRRLPAIEFPPGTTYRVALNRLLRSVVETGTIPGSARVVGRLPSGIVWQKGAKRRGPRLDLTAPWGYTLPGGLVRAPTLRVEPSVPRARASAIFAAFMNGTPMGVGKAEGLSADAPKLARCQIRASITSRRACAIRPPATTPG